LVENVSSQLIKHAVSACLLLAEQAVEALETSFRLYWTVYLDIFLIVDQQGLQNGYKRRKNGSMNR